MVPILNELFVARGRLSPAAARASLLLAGLVLAIGLLGAFTLEGEHRVAFSIAFTLMSLGNLLRGVGSLVPEARGGKVARLAVTPVAVMMVIALAVTLWFQAGLR